MECFTIFLAVCLCQNYSSFAFIIKRGFFSKISDVLKPNSQFSLDYVLISKIHNLLLLSGGTQGVASRYAYITQITMFPHHTVASAVTGTAMEYSIWSTCKGSNFTQSMDVAKEYFTFRMPT